MRKTKEQKGITLIALIVTIVILLILAIVTINAVKGDGIIGYAKKAKDEYSAKSEEEKKTLGDYLSLIESSLVGGNSTIDGDNTIPGENPDDTNNPGEEIVDTRQEYTIGEIRTENGTINGEAYSSSNPIIPAGFQAKNTETSLWNAEDGPEVENGLVITDGTNEFVWVPVTSTIAAYNVGTTDYREPDVVTEEEVYNSDTESWEWVNGADNNPTYLGKVNEILGTNYQNSNDFKTDLETDFNSMATSVNTYGGFYVGRYEMSLSSDKIAQSKYGETSSDASQEDTNTWYGLYARAKTYVTSSVQSSMIWGSQWNATITWMGDAANTGIGDDRNKREDRKTGLVETDKIKNVYDLHGNSLEWTLEASSVGSRVVYGGYYDNGNTPSDFSNFGPNNNNSYIGSRLTLYIV